MPPPAPVSSWARMLNSIRQNGFLGFHRQMLRMNDAKVGRLVGTDYIGNKYYENDNEHSGRNRWVDYGQEDFNGTQVPPEWHAWLNAIRKDPPHLDPVMQRSAQKWQTVSFENLTGTRGANTTYSTVAPKMLAWEPKITPRK